jgi:hypothetical protein
MTDKSLCRSALFWDITQRRVVIVYRRFGTMYWSHLHGSRVWVGKDSWPVKMGPIHCPETSVNNYFTTPHNIPEERRSHQHCGGSLKSMSFCSLSVFVSVAIKHFMRSDTIIYEAASIKYYDCVSLPCLSYVACNHIIFSSMACLALLYFSTLSHKLHDFHGGGI